INLQAAGISLLTAQVVVTDANGNVVGSAVADSPLNNDLTIHVNNAVPGENYFITVQGAPDSGVFGIGSYHLSITPDNAAPATPPAATSTGVPQLLSPFPGYAEHTYYELDSTLTAAAPSVTYQVQSADIGPGLTNVMTVTLTTEDGSPPPADITIRDS